MDGDIYHTPYKGINEAGRYGHDKHVVIYITNSRVTPSLFPNNHTCTQCTNPKLFTLKLFYQRRSPEQQIMPKRFGSATKLPEKKCLYIFNIFTQEL
ncbi:hypothetical protein RRG08_037908 [Elysia crispata]|uniref:Uncharacterized protein n=1 Tax=Elysia crispata TaxID=231223 RepID=A0AAE0ZKB9_9GAST|nr:hypothetical protein RRG08_037908 [Elysia crispata]